MSKPRNLWLWMVLGAVLIGVGFLVITNLFSYIDAKSKSEAVASLHNINNAMELFKKHGTYYVPTILAGATVAERAKIDGYFPALVRPKAAAIGPKIQETFSRAYKAGVKIAFGTDSCVSPHGINAPEFELMVQGGMLPM